MSNGRSSRRTTISLARAAAVATILLATSAGCNRLPLRRIEITPESDSAPTTQVESAADAPGPETPSGLPSEPAPGLDVSRASETIPVSANPGYRSKSSPTPHLDAALARAEAIDSPMPTATADVTPVDLPDLSPAGGLTKVSAPAETTANLEFEPTPTEPTPTEQAPANPVVAEEPKADQDAALSTLFDMPRSTPPTTSPEPRTESEPQPQPEAAPLESPEAEVEPRELPPLEIAPAEVMEKTDGQVARADIDGPLVATTEPPTLEATPPAPVEAQTVDTWDDCLARLRKLSREKAGAPGQGDESWEIRARVLDWLVGDESNNPHQQVWTSVLAALSLTAVPETADEAIVAPRIREAVEALESLAPLRITDLRFCRKISGFGLHETMDPSEIRPGQPVLLYCEMSGLHYEPADGAFCSRLGSRVEILPSDSPEAVWSKSLDTAEDRCLRRRRDYYVNYRIVLPDTLTPGSYTLRLTQTDLATGAAVSAQLPLAVNP